MRHPSPTDDRQPPRNPSPPRWTFGGGLASPSSGTEVIYDSPEEHDEEDEVDDDEDDEDDDDDSGDDNERDAGEDGQLSVHEGLLHKD